MVDKIAYDLRKGSERRTSSRYRLSQPPEVEILHAESGTCVKTRLGDLSRGGCYVEIDLVLPLETEITIKLKKNGDELSKVPPNVHLAQP